MNPQRALFVLMILMVSFSFGCDTGRGERLGLETTCRDGSSCQPFDGGTSADKDGSSEAGTDPCSPRRCVVGDCGVISDGCGGTLACECQTFDAGMPSSRDAAVADAAASRRDAGSRDAGPRRDAGSTGGGGTGTTCTDELDPNNSTHPRTLGPGSGTVWTEDPSTEDSWSGLKIAGGQADWYRIRIMDGGDFLDPWPYVTIRPDDGETHFRVELYYDCTTGTDATYCSRGTLITESPYGRGCSGESGLVTAPELVLECNDDAVDASGTLLIRVRAPEGTPTRTCLGYSLEVEVQ